jgi:hypothetical protein
MFGTKKKNEDWRWPVIQNKGADAAFQCENVNLFRSVANQIRRAVLCVHVLIAMNESSIAVAAHHHDLLSAFLLSVEVLLHAREVRALTAN